IASPGTFRNHLESAYGLKKFKSFADHHPFSPQELQTMVDDCVNFAGPSGKLVCTEKDAVRLGHILEQVQWKVPLFFIPVGTAFLHGKDPLSDLLGQSAGDRKA
ncbi:MAG: tetraacyldisaccharide 4'-kinase, partial [Flavobacteriales bacterium]|nr:tetraacyldisaccharide 4'-kinase [Flavobacteriales bacterium]